MKRKTTVLVIGAIAALIVIAGSWLVSRAVVGTGSGLWVLRSGLMTLGLAAVGLAVWYFLKRAAAQEAEAPATGPDDIDLAVAAAKRRLADAKLAGGGSLGTLPLLLVLGPNGAAKTTTVVRSGLEPELLAGEMSHGEVVPTRAANVWYAGGTIVVEAGGPVAADQGRWARLVRHVHPQRLSAVFARGAQAPRAALVCFSCEDLLRPGSSESVLAAARSLRARLGELAEQLGIRLPVYVLFTKLDRVPYFAEYVQNFSREETQQVLGATLEAELGAPIGSYADRESGRVNEAFAGIIHSLSEKRLLVLGREHAAERRPGAYEFPRELRKVVPVVTQFLVDLCKPSQLQASPFLRGFYFTGVQAVVVTEAAPAAVAQPAARVAASAMDATSVFRSPVATAAPPMPLAAPTSRKVPRWVFLDGVFRNVILADRAAGNVTKSGTKVVLLRRAALGSAVAAAVLLSVAFTGSFARNRGMQNGLVAAAEAVAVAPAPGADLPTLDALQRLDSLRARVAVLRQHATDGAPLSFRWGLYGGDGLLGPARATYFANFDRLIFESTRRSMVNELAALPDAPRAGDEYAVNYDLLKAYLITSSHPQHSNVDSLPPVLMRSFLAGRTVEPDRVELIQRQFTFYASELLIGNPLATDPDPATVRHARTFLAKFSGAANIYQFMLDEARKANPTFRFPANAGGSPQALSDGYEVHGAFTKAGWTFVQTALGGVIERFFSREPWVMGDQAAAPGDSVAIVRELRTRYIADYQREWRTFLRQASVSGFANVSDAARKLTVLSGNQSPVLYLLSLVAQNTNVDTVAIGPAFQPVHYVTPPLVTDILIGPGNKPYMEALVGLTSAADQAAKAPAGQEGPALTNMAASASTALAATRGIAQNFKRDPQGGTETMSLVQTLMERPIILADGLTRATGSSALNAAGGSFCGPFQELMAKFPFSSGSVVDATFDEIARIFHPTDGSLGRLYRESLSRAIVRQGNEYLRQPGAQIQVSEEFLRFFNRAMAISSAFYRENPTNPTISFNFLPIFSANLEWVQLSIDGNVQRFSKNDLTARPFQWRGPLASEATLMARAGRTEGRVVGYTGPWALFRLVHDVEQWQGGGSGIYSLSWLMSVNGRVVTHENAEVQVRAQLNLGSAPPIFNNGYFSGLACVPRIAG